MEKFRVNLYASGSHMQVAVDAYLRGAEVEFDEHIHLEQWNYFYEKTKGKAGRIIVDCPMPTDWPVDPSMKIVVRDGWMIEVTESMHEFQKQFPIQHHRQIDSFEYEFVLPYGAWSHERETLMQALERLKVLENSIYSRPAQETKWQEHINIDYLFPIRSDAVPRTIDTKGRPSDSDTANNWSNLHDVSKKVHCWVVVDNWPFNKQITGGVSEKLLFPIVYGVPFIYVGNREQRRTLERWGFRPNDPFKTDVRGVVEQMQWLRSIFRDPILAQQWQDCQGETILSNQKISEKLLDILKAGN